MDNLRSLRNTIISQEDAASLLAPHLDRIKGCCLDGFSAWKEFAAGMPHLRFPLTSRTMANFVNDWVVHQARIEFASVSGVEPFEDYGLYSIGFNRRVLLRFKKSDDGDHPRNYPTKQQVEIAGQQLLIPGWVEPTWVNAAYHFDPAGEAIDRILITCWLGEHLIWSLPVYDVRADAETGVIPFATRPESQQRPSRVRAKNVKKPDDA